MRTLTLTLIGRTGRREVDWAAYALLRDNVQHFIEDGQPSPRFAALHSIEAAVDTGALHAIDAARLRGEVLQACCRLSKIELGDAAVSIRTRSILTGCAGQPATRGMASARHTGWHLPLRAPPDTPLRLVVADFVGAVLELTETAVDGEQLTVRRQPGKLRALLPNTERKAS